LNNKLAQFTDITVMLDRSGSMESIKKTMESALNELMIAHRKNPTTKFTLVQFDGENPYELVFENRSATEVPDIVIHPRGSTPLIDCLCRTIDKTGDRLRAMRESERPDQVLMIVITDGQENSSREFTRKHVKDRISKQRNEYNWQFMFLGADERSIAEATSWGISPDFTVQWAMGKSAVLMDNLTTKTASYVANNVGARGMSSSLNYTADDRQKLSEEDPKLGSGTGTGSAGSSTGSTKGANGTS